MENALFDVAISNAIIDYQPYSLKENLNEITQEKRLNFYQDGTSVLERDFQKNLYAYRDLHQYYVAIYGVDNKVGNSLQEVLQDSETFFHYLVNGYEHEALENNHDEILYAIPLKDEAYEGSEIISAIIRDLETIKSDVYADKESSDRQSWETLVIKSEEYAQSDEVQQDLKKIQQYIKLWSE